MKKKVLTTAMALAMLAPTMTSFASSTDKTIQGLDTKTHQSDLKIQGTVNNSTGQAPVGQISVTLPTAVSFVVDQDGNFTAANTMTIENKSQVGVSVSVSAFSDTTPDSSKGITITSDVDGSEDQYDRSFMSLRLKATGGTNGSTVQLLSSGFQETKLVDLGANATTGLSLVGNAGTAGHDNAAHKGTAHTDNDGVTDEFTLTFKIAKQ